MILAVVHLFRLLCIFLIRVAWGSRLKSNFPGVVAGTELTVLYGFPAGSISVLLHFLP